MTGEIKSVYFSKLPFAALSLAGVGVKQARTTAVPFKERSDEPGATGGG
jgi:hypothetical protein